MALGISTRASLLVADCKRVGRQGPYLPMNKHGRASASLAGSKEHSNLISLPPIPPSTDISELTRDFSPWSAQGHSLKHRCLLTARAIIRLTVLFLPRESKCHRVLGAVSPYPGKPRRVPSVLAPRMGRSGSTKGHTPTVHDRRSPVISAKEGHALETSEDLMLLHWCPFSPFPWVFVVSPHSHVEESQQAHLWVQLLSLYDGTGLACERRGRWGRDGWGMCIWGPTVKRAAVKPPQFPIGLHMLDSPQYPSCLSGFSFFLKLFIGLESRNPGAA